MTTRIIGTGSGFPEKIVSNHDLAEVVDTNDEWISSRTGIRERRISAGENTSQLAIKAAREAIADANVDVEEIDLIIVATSTPDNIFPNTASLVQIGIHADNAACYDLSAACSGFLFALNTAHAFIKAGIYKKAIVIGSEVMSKTLDWNDRGTCVLFGDGAGAVVVAADEQGIEEMIMCNDGSKADALVCEGRKVENFLIDREDSSYDDDNDDNDDNDNDDASFGYVKMDGQEVFKFAVKKVPECITQVLEKNKTPIEDVRYFVLHQANIRIIQSVAKRLNVEISKFPVNLEKYGNTSAASIPILLDEMNRNNMIARGDKIVLSGFGAGLSWGATVLTW